ncbi:exodeoxyribonuclease VII large subunit [Sulfitobacter donghicola]|uniref:Exodeoxyribonuclease 7 large subunit n=1 Tax=Sulfitobacter donghicola DSW-25 = KCTC 12864 = JCM 14565 TaxID=1300350 RepID=A0A073II87_9RHOB|nr:exodeoxyribonuclease VII large subunit [Sulfitobacter donghicola]KEJ90013.1 exodeoxyribonuclease VII large subunit [Sulfitobacter donghicola DSW-25 = KCTC 12864 = JCM 14565]KIN66857.1 Exodeoxyribonuclease 7 large subunit [Sulfitobacter donghicola DSW-25 = KCTC 12864 = JCM 14565]
MDLFDDRPDDGPERSNSPEYTVGELSGAIKKVIENEFGHVCVRAEVGRVSLPRSGHMYLDLKDDKAVMAGIIWKGVAAKLTTLPEEGMEVIATGRITTFPGQSKYQIIIEDIKPAGMGALMAVLEKRKAALAAEGLFDASRKKPLPYLPEIIGVVTSPSGAVIRDILHRLRDRFPRKVLIWPVAVQGARSAPEVARGIEGFNRLTPGGALPRPDLLIVARGGGSVEDLWGFNEEAVVRAAAASDIPLISAVGHETDTTLIDFVSDKRAPTPTAAAELAVPVRVELMAYLDQQHARMSRALSQGLVQRGQRLRDMARALPRADSLLDNPRQRLDRASDRLARAKTLTEAPKLRLERAAARLDPALMAGVQQRKIRLSDLSGGLRPATLHRRLQQDKQRAASLSKRLAPALERERLLQSARYARAARGLSDVGQRQLVNWRNQITAAERLRKTLGYEATLERGFAVVRNGAEIVTSGAEAQQKPRLEIQFADGKVAVKPE